MALVELDEIVKHLAAPGKGILAADEPIDYMQKSLNEANLDNTQENRRLYRQLLFTTDPVISDYISGVILHPETVQQKTDDGIPFVQLLKSKGILSGVNVDGGLAAFRPSSPETITRGLDGLDKRCQQFRSVGCYFAKWRCAFRVTPTTPTSLAIYENSIVLARYALDCQKNGLVPIVEPDILLEGDHDLERARDVVRKILAAVYKALNDYGVILEYTILKTSMVTPGKSCFVRCKPEQIGRATIDTFRQTVPSAVPCAGFLSGGQTADEATRNLLAIKRCAGNVPWTLSFIFGRALQGSVPKTWAGKVENIKVAQQELIERARANSRACLGLEA